MNSSNTTTTFFNNSTSTSTIKGVDPKRDSICISIEEFEDLIKYRKICKSIFEEFGELLELEKEDD